MADVDLTFINAALTLTGNPAITSLSDPSSSAQVAAQNYATLVKQGLSKYRWKWASKQADLGPALTDTPELPWTYAYQLPSDLLLLRNIQVGGYSVDYQLLATKVLCDQDGTTPLIATYTWSPPESAWPGFFSAWIVAELESMFLRGVGERHAEAEIRAKEALRRWAEAKRLDSQSQPAVDPTTHPTLSARSGYDDRVWNRYGMRW